MVALKYIKAATVRIAATEAHSSQSKALKSLSEKSHSLRRNALFLWGFRIVSTCGLLLDVDDVDFDSELSSEHITYLSSVTRPAEFGERFKLIRARSILKVSESRTTRPNKVA